MDSTIKVRELQRCDTVKAIAMLAVVICHCAAGCASQGWFVVSPVKNSSVLIFISGILGYYHVQTFTFTSGYLFYYLKYELGKYGNSLEFVKKKAMRLLLPYVIACIWVVPAYAYFFRPSAIELVKKYALGVGPSQLWFLLMLFLVFVGFYFFSKFLDRYNFFEKMTFKTAIAVLVFFYFVDFCSPAFDRLGMENVFQFMTACRYFFYFFAGFIFRKFDFSRLYKYAWLLMILSVLSMLGFMNFVHGKAVFILTHPVCLLNCVAVFVCVTKYVNPKGKIFELLKKYSFQIYLIHQQLIYVILFLLDKYWAVYSYPAFVIAFVGSVAISLAITACMARIKPLRLALGIKQ